MRAGYIGVNLECYGIEKERSGVVDRGSGVRCIGSHVELVGGVHHVCRQGGAVVQHRRVVGR